jgi:hypothetical protein
VNGFDKMLYAVRTAVFVSQLCMIWGSDSGGYEEFYLLWFRWKSADVSGEHAVSILRPFKSPTCYLLSLVCCLVYSSILKMDATCSSEASVEIQRTTRRYIPEDKIKFYFGSISPLLYTTLEWYFLLSGFLSVTVDGVWIGNWIYWTL